MNLSKLKEVQKELSSRVEVTPFEGVPKLLAGFDLSFPRKGLALAVGVVLSYPSLELIEMKWTLKDVDIPYIPGLLSFREGPAIETVYSMLENEPDLLFFDGQGIAHPRGLGIASHMAIKFGKPSIGVAKSHLYGEYRMPLPSRGDFEYLYEGSLRIGIVLRTKDGVKPLFVSPGSFVDLEDCRRYVMETSKGYKLPEPTRIADYHTKRLRKEVIDSDE